ncbi:hypothetical protein BDN70DRAFT_878533 [Pholiota conissans]|uniref:Uncharacterized protein n=1 Tax=Pholiota conissans TaxID=109636 RepID=A0A9P5Z1Y8_9AGAR|nr:hypothetical protein BDN70DRAFT_878533 [Pholiota conissans]
MGENPTSPTSSDSKMTVLTTDASRPSIPLITITSPFSGDKLDKEKNNWTDWHDNIYSITCLSGLWGYIKGTTPCPPLATEPRAFNNWTQNDERACAFLFGAIEYAERKAVTLHTTDAAAYFKALEARHVSDGPVAQVYLIKDAMGIHATPGEPFTKGLDTLFDKLDRAWKMGDITLDVLKSILTLNFFGKDFQEIQFALQDRMKTATKAKPFTASEIRQFVEDRQRLIDANNRSAGESNTSTALAAKDKKKTSNICVNCKRPGHAQQYCIMPNGGMAGKTIEESKAQRAKDKASKNPAPSTSAKSTTTTQKTMRDEATGAIYLVSLPEDAKPVTPAQAHIAIDNNFDRMIFSTDDLEREGDLWGS